MTLKDTAGSAVTIGPEQDLETIFFDEIELRRLSRLPLTDLLNSGIAIEQYLWKIFRTIQSSEGSSAQSNAAVNALCAILDRSSLGENHEHPSVRLSTAFRLETLHLYLTKSHVMKSKPGRRLLMTAVKTAFIHSDTLQTQTLIKQELYKCLQAVRDFDGVVSVKACLQLLDYLIEITLVSAVDILVTRDGAHPVPDIRFSLDEHPQLLESLKEAVTTFCLDVFTWIRYPDCAPVISRLLSRFFRLLYAEMAICDANEPHFMQMWLDPVKMALQDDPELLDCFEHHVMPGLSKLQADQTHHLHHLLPFHDILKQRSAHCTDAEILMCLLVAKSSTVSDLEFSSQEKLHTEEQPSMHDLDTRLGLVLTEHASPVIRINALALLIHRANPLHYLSDVLACFRRCIPFFQSESEPKTRNNYIALVKVMVMKLHSRIKRLLQKKNTSMDELSVSVTASLERHLDFVKWFQEYLIRDLRPTASYQSHITALKILPSFLGEESVTNKLNSAIDDVYTNSTSMYDQMLERSVLDLLLDPFDDVRQAADILIRNLADQYVESAASQQKCNSLETRIKTAMSRAAGCLQRSGRADHADGFGRLYSLLHDDLDSFVLEVEDETNNLLQNFPESAKESLIHGSMIGARYIVTYQSEKVLDKAALNQDISSRLLRCCTRVWGVVRNVLCYDAPEGHVIDLENSDEADSGSKHILSFCWRSLKESSLLMRTVMEAWPGSISSHDYKHFGDVVMSQLAELRHRGAFSTVAQTFTAWCTACSRSSDTFVAILPQLWYQETLACIQQQSNALTRRSAGLPAMIVSILAASIGQEIFEAIILDLQAIADAPIETISGGHSAKLPQVHALNCLKDIFTDARFGLRTEQYMADTLSIAISCLQSSVWAIRNCGLMLLNSLLRRINGGGDTESMKVSSSHRRCSPVTHENYPVLSTLLLRLMQYRPSDSDLKSFEIHLIFPALEIVERFGLPKLFNQDFLNAMKVYRQSPHWGMREKAAKAISSVIAPSNLLSESRSLLDEHWSSQNDLHGKLLCLQFSMQRMQLSHSYTSTGDRAKLSVIIQEGASRLLGQSICPVNRALIQDVLRDHLKEVESPESHCVSSEHPSAKTFDFMNGTQIEPMIMNMEGMSYSLSQSVEKTATILAVRRHPTDISPHQYRQELVAAGRIVGEQIASFLDCPESSRLAGIWVRALFLALDENSDIATRFAGLTSIELFFETLRQPNLSPHAGQQLFELFPVLYDSLVDDDDEIRARGAKIVCKFLSKDRASRTGLPTTLDLSAAASRPGLLHYLIHCYSGRQALLVESLWRLSGIDKSISIDYRVGVLTHDVDNVTSGFVPELKLPPVSDILKIVTKEQTVVFEEEKQNLYIDPVCETDTWTNVALSVEEQAWSQSLWQELATWVVDGLECLGNGLEGSEESPLGLSSKKDVFSLFTQVINASKVLMNSKHLIAPQLEPQLSTRLQKGLDTMYKIGCTKALHPLILTRLQSARLGSLT